MSVEVVQPARVYPRNAAAAYIYLVGRARKRYVSGAVYAGGYAKAVDIHINFCRAVAFYAHAVTLEFSVNYS